MLLERPFRGVANAWIPLSSGEDIENSEGWSTSVPLRASPYVPTTENLESMSVWFAALPTWVAYHYAFHLEMYYHAVYDEQHNIGWQQIELLRHIHTVADRTGWAYNIKKVLCPFTTGKCSHCVHGLGGYSFYIMGPWTCYRVQNGIVEDRKMAKHLWSEMWKQCRQSYYPCEACRAYMEITHPGSKEVYMTRKNAWADSRRWDFNVQDCHRASWTCQSETDLTNRPLRSQHHRAATQDDVW